MRVVLSNHLAVQEYADSVVEQRILPEQIGLAVNEIVGVQ